MILQLRDFNRRSANSLFSESLRGRENRNAWARPHAISFRCGTLKPYFRRLTVPTSLENAV
jgi:hypothetical protein